MQGTTAIRPCVTSLGGHFGADAAMQNSMQRTDCMKEDFSIFPELTPGSLAGDHHRKAVGARVLPHYPATDDCGQVNGDIGLFEHGLVPISPGVPEPSFIRTPSPEGLPRHPFSRCGRWLNTSKGIGSTHQKTSHPQRSSRRTPRGTDRKHHIDRAPTPTRSVAQRPRPPSVAITTACPHDSSLRRRLIFAVISIDAVIRRRG